MAHTCGLKAQQIGGSRSEGVHGYPLLLSVVSLGNLSYIRILSAKRGERKKKDCVCFELESSFVD